VGRSGLVQSNLEPFDGVGGIVEVPPLVHFDSEVNNRPVETTPQVPSRHDNSIKKMYLPLLDTPLEVHFESS
jgi:hypothetical protein